MTKSAGSAKAGRLWVVLAAFLAMAGMLITAYLAKQSLASEAVAGCGGDAGCAQVLASRWAKLGPIPVSALALLVYLGVLLGLGARLGAGGGNTIGDRLLWFAPPVFVIGGIWFVGLQLFEAGAVCPYCMAGHTIGFLLSGLLLFGVLRTTAINPKPILLFGFLSAGFLITAQVAMPPPAPDVQRAANPFVDQDGDTVIDDQRYLSLFGGELQFVLQDVAYIGDPRAKQVVVVLFDYACPHCKKLHKMLEDAMAKDPKRFVLVPLPLTAFGGHNPYIDSDNPRFEYSHEIAALSLAVANADREKWVQFDRWLFNQSQPIDRTAARVKVEQLIGLPALTEQLEGDNAERITDNIARSIELLALIPEDKRFIPVTTTPGAPEHLTTRYEEIEVLYELLESAAKNLELAP